MRNYVQAGDVMTVAAPANVSAGAGVIVGGLFGVALSDALSGALVQINTTGVVTLLKAAGTINPGVRVFWDNAASRVTTTAAGNFCIGFHAGTVANSGAAGTDILVLLRPAAPAGA